MQLRSLQMILIVILLIAGSALISFSSVVIADEEVASEELSEQVSSDSLPPTNIDSLYSVIQSDFVALEPIWKKACYDCHTDKTDYPWYYKLPVVKGMIDRDIEEARTELDMSNGFPFVSARKPVDDLRKLKAEVVEGHMPPGNYKLMHWSARLSQEEKDTISVFVDNSLSMLAAHGIVPTQRQRPLESE